MPPKSKVPARSSSGAAAAADRPSPAARRRRERDRARKLSESELPAVKHVEDLQVTLTHFPRYDLRSREEFKNDERPHGIIGGRTWKKTVLTADGQEFLLKKNAREASMEEDPGVRTPSSAMDLDKNHAESFREICALRLFQMISQGRDVVPDVKIVISDFDSEKVRNKRKGEFTKVYIASRKVGDVPFDIMRLSVENHKKLEAKDGHLFRNQVIIDRLCEDMVLMALLSNPDAIKFDNFIIDEGAGRVTHLDFGDARHNEYLNPDPICMLDAIRKHVDGNSTRSTTETFAAENLAYSVALKFFHRHISPQHILTIIEKLKLQPEDELWQIAYAYSYGDQTEKRGYANCFVARVRNLIKLEGPLREVIAVPDFSSKQVRNILAHNASYREAKGGEGIVVGMKEMFACAEEVVHLLEEEVIVEEDDKVVFEEDDEVVFEEESSSVEEEDLGEQEEGESEEESEELDDDLVFDEDSAGEDLTSSELGEGEEVDPIAALLQKLSKYRRDIIAVCKAIESGLATPLDKKEELPEGSKSKTSLKRTIVTLQTLVENFYQIIKNAEYPYEGLPQFIADEQEKINEVMYAALTHHDAYEAFRAIQAQGYAYDEERAKIIDKKFAALGVAIQDEPSLALRRSLDRINSGSAGQAGVAAGRL